MSERRGEVRRRTLLAGRLAADHLTTRDCVVRNMSSRGARLLCRTTGLGDVVTLEIRSTRRFKKDARIVWRRLEDCGVEFRLMTRRTGRPDRIVAAAIAPAESPLRLREPETLVKLKLGVLGPAGTTGYGLTSRRG